MQQKRLNKNQRKVQKELERKVYAAKADAKNLSRGIPHKHIKIATRKLTELYDTAEFRNNHKFLLKRYANLEKREKMWNNLFLPVILSLLMSETLIAKIISVFVSETASTINEIMTLREILPTMPMWVQVLFWTTVGVSMLAVGVSILLLGRCLIMLFKSFSRSPEEIIKDNETKIIEKILINEGVFID